MPCSGRLTLSEASHWLGPASPVPERLSAVDAPVVGGVPVTGVPVAGVPVAGDAVVAGGVAAVGRALVGGPVEGGCDRRGRGAPGGFGPGRAPAWPVAPPWASVVGRRHLDSGPCG